MKTLNNIFSSFIKKTKNILFRIISIISSASKIFFLSIGVLSVIIFIVIYQGFQKSDNLLNKVKNIKSYQHLSSNDETSIILDLSNIVIDREHKIYAFDSKEKINFFELIQNIENLKTETKLKSVFVKLDEGNAYNFNESMVISEKIRELNAKNIETYVFAKDIEKLKDFIIFSSFKNRFINKSSGLQTWKISSEIFTLGKGLKKLGLSANFIQAGDYKGVANIFTDDNISENIINNATKLIDSLNINIINSISKNLKKSPSELEHVISGNYLNANMLISNKIATKISSKYSFDELIDEKTENLETVEMDKLVIIDKNKKNKQNKIAILYINGEIIDSSITESVEEIANDNEIKAVILRINSPGGGVVATEEIVESIQHLLKDKVIIASLGSVAASGGYWIATTADKIIAQENSITGSIGVVSGYISLDEKARENLGVESLIIGDHPYPITRKPSAENYEKIKKRTDAIYEEFKKIVKKSRKMNDLEIDEASGGRVFTGSDAKKLKLVDYLGSYNVAIKHAKELAKIKDTEIKFMHFPKQNYEIRKFIEEFYSEENINDDESNINKKIKIIASRMNSPLYSGKPAAQMPLEYIFIK